MILGKSHPGAGASLLSPWGGVRGAHLGVRPSAARVATTSADGAAFAATSVIAMQQHVDHWGSIKRKRALRARSVAECRGVWRCVWCVW